jgi:hypothetical protein
MALFDVATGGMIVNINDVPTATRWNYPRVNPDGTLNLTVIDTEEVISVPYTGFSTDGLGSIELGPAAIPIVNRINTTVTPLEDGVYRVQKTGGTDGPFDGSAVSSEGLSGDFVLKMFLSTPNDSQLGWLGVNSDPLTNDDYTSGDYGLLLSGGVWYVYESGGAPDSFVSTGEPIWIKRVANTLSYGQGATLETATFLARTVFTSATLYFDSSIQDQTAVIDVSFSEA